MGAGEVVWAAGVEEGRWRQRQKMGEGEKCKEKEQEIGPVVGKDMDKL